MPSPEDPKHSFSQRQRVMGGMNTAVTVAIVFAVCVMLNYIAAGHFERYFLARDAAFKLSRETTAVLDSLTNQVEITIFFQANGGNEEVYNMTRSLLTEYQNENPSHVHVHTLDYSRLAGEATKLLMDHKLGEVKEKDFVMIESGGHSKLIYARELSGYDFEDLMTGKSKTVRRNAFKGELMFTSAIFAVSHPQLLKTYFLAGHGENNPGEPNKPPDDLGNFGYSKLAAILKDEIDSDWAKLILNGTNDVPKDCQLLIVAGPKGEFLPEEVSRIAAYLKNGGRMLVLLTHPSSGLEVMLSSQWGIGFGTEPVVDPAYAEGPSSFLAVKLTQHLIMDPLIQENRGVRMVLTRPIYHVDEHSKVPGAPQFTPLANTSDKGVDVNLRTNSYILIAAVEQGVIPGVDNPKAGGTRIIAAGDSTFLDDQVIESGGANHDFAELALNWLLQRPAIVLQGLVPSPIKEYRLILTTSQATRVRWLFLVLMPASVLALGTLVWLRRRR